LNAPTGRTCRFSTPDFPVSRRRLERTTREGESPVGEAAEAVRVGVVSTTGHVVSRGKLGGPPSKAKYPQRPIVHEYREGKVKSTPVRGVKENLKPCAYKQSEGVAPFGVA
jgi:hypothetical protein